ncbi:MULTISPECIES: LacI family DNA-binding transcriptional regulator [Segatella]|jgi:LacI family transcriptional regulator/LacI family repressor for deo operon, udp, cdd, tsx, nupC, and nupG|uniref:Transcriptional regulator, LacI family n=2 Tax=Segatella TaxID=2974251 RepID=D8DXY4_9BACT|nr:MULTISPECIES: LacI family DNA-binding transcriptional regulator [Segatella]EFI71670.1 transcriptional regulator, LacI family [Segatella baroniae B14]MDR4930167.1 LacI family DNA-binding transcriptional regulator [Segatella bryantii]OYP55915.1 LacI family transcriptional regulator [Segatella bryantii]UKK76501.1 LacI family transcriptional regulator [Segatella bryantii]UKK78100.1 LacI family transcriptional regulator [Segatella baroniae B14]
MKEQSPITMKDIARELHVSVATVSRALKDSPRISKEQRDRIQTYAREHNFYPNVIGEALRLSKIMPMKIIGVIIPEFIHYYFASILTGIEEEASARGYRIMVAQSDERYEREVQICDSFYKNKVCGIIVSQAKDTTKHDHFQKLINSGVPLVFYDRICTGVDCSRVVVDDYMGAFTAVTHLIDTGCKRIAYYGSSMTMEIAKNRYNGYKDALLQHGLKLDESLIHICDNRASAEAITPDLLSKENRPDAFFAINDDTAIGILYTAKRMGFRIPDDISICGFTNGNRAKACDPMLTTVEQRGTLVGEEAANILIGHVEGSIPKDKVEKRVVRTRLVIRGTTR